ncbi:SDR family oxidoreductase [Nocardia sp. NPDC058705]|uniref:SDR family oxidoreductase n=1 Tax=Nocardia sp. NPDC058705 TaxID=3346609 RepID=UPI0036BB999D
MTILVTGATGKVGRHVLAQLTESGYPTRAASRRAPIGFDWTEPDTWGRALAGVEKIFTVVPGGDDGHRSVRGLGARTCAFLDMAQDAGVTTVVLMTAMGMQYAPTSVEQRAVELHLQNTDMRWTILRPNWFFQNLTEGPLRDLATAGDGVLRLPTGGARVSFIDAEDIAACAVTALVGDHSAREFDLTGAEALTFSEVAALTARSRIPLSGYEDSTVQQFHALASRLGWHREYITTLAGLFDAIASGANAPVVPDASDLLGRPTRRLSQFVAEATP